MDATQLPALEADDAHKIDRKSARRPRVELITRGERRRRWSIEQKQEIVAESLGADTTPTEVARKHAISSGLLQYIHGGNSYWAAPQLDRRHDRHPPLPRLRSLVRHHALRRLIACQWHWLDQPHRRVCLGSMG